MRLREKVKAVLVAFGVIVWTEMEDGNIVVDPFSVILLVVSVALWIHDPPIREEWHQRTTIGKLGLVLTIPVWLFSLFLSLIGMLVAGALLFVEIAPQFLWLLYRDAAYKEEAPN